MSADHTAASHVDEEHHMDVEPMDVEEEPVEEEPVTKKRTKSAKPTKRKADADEDDDDSSSTSTSTNKNKSTKQRNPSPKGLYKAAKNLETKLAEILEMYDSQLRTLFQADFRVTIGEEAAQKVHAEIIAKRAAIESEMTKEINDLRTKADQHDEEIKSKKTDKWNHAEEELDAHLSVSKSKIRKIIDIKAKNDVEDGTPLERKRRATDEAIQAIRALIDKLDELAVKLDDDQTELESKAEAAKNAKKATKATKATKTEKSSKKRTAEDGDGDDDEVPIKKTKTNVSSKKRRAVVEDDKATKKTKTDDEDEVECC
jgi:hypothetical protein